MAESWTDRLMRRFENTLHPTAVMAGVCQSYTLTQMRDLLAHGASITTRAKNTTAFVKYADILGPAGDKLADASAKLDGLARKGSTALGDVKGACEMSAAVSVLNRWTLSESSVSQQEAAKAFDKLFGGAATFFKKLPPPVNAYASILASVAEFGFFSHMQDIMDPESPNTARGRQLRQIMDSMDK